MRRIIDKGCKPQGVTPLLYDGEGRGLHRTAQSRQRGQGPWQVNVLTEAATRATARAEQKLCFRVPGAAQKRPRTPWRQGRPENIQHQQQPAKLGAGRQLDKGRKLTGTGRRGGLPHGLHDLKLPRFGGALIRRPSGYGLALPVTATKPRPGDPHRRGVYRKQRRNERRNEDAIICYVICNIISRL